MKFFPNIIISNVDWTDEKYVVLINRDQQRLKQMNILSIIYFWFFYKILSFDSYYTHKSMLTMTSFELTVVKRIARFVCVRVDSINIYNN